MREPTKIRSQKPRGMKGESNQEIQPNWDVEEQENETKWSHITEKVEGMSQKKPP